MGDDIETGRSTYRFRLLSCTTLVEQKSKQMAIDDRPAPMSSPINNPAKFRPLVLKFISLLLKLTSFDKMA